MSRYEEARAPEPGSAAASGKSAGSPGRGTGQRTGPKAAQRTGQGTGPKAAQRTGQGTGHGTKQTTVRETGSSGDRESPGPWSEERIRLSKLITKKWLCFYAALIVLGLLVLLIRPEVSQGLGVILTGPTDIAVAIVISYFVHSGVEGNFSQYFSSRSRERGSLFDFSGSRRYRSGDTVRGASAEDDVELEEDLSFVEEDPEDPAEEYG